jgi:enamine deaminase RidA (YjgF/YER057c/UK114 family)
MPTETIAYLNPENTCPAQGLYSHATKVPASGKTLYIAGQLSVGLDGSVVGKNDFATQMHQVLDNLSAVLKGTGLELTTLSNSRPTLSIRRT